jgi:hypothetical protein
MAVVVVLMSACSSTPDPMLPSASAASAAEAAEELGAVPWYSAARAWDAQEVQQPAFTLAAGWIGEEDPTLSAVIPMAFGIEVLDMARAPAVAMNGAGLIVYVSDDGTSSELHRTSVDGNPDDDVVTELPEVVSGPRHSPRPVTQPS